MNKLYLVLVVMTIFLSGCGSDSKKSTTTETDPLANLEVPETYAFDSKFDSTKSSVSYSGQVLRQVLIKEISVYIKALTAKIDADELSPATGEVVDALKFYYEFDSTVAGTNALGFTATPAIKQQSFNEISSNKNLKEKLAGNDLVGQHKDWATEFKGWDDTGVTGVAGSVKTPEDLLLSFFIKLDEIVVNRSNGNPELDPDGNTITVAHVTANGLNLQELIDKFLLGAVAYSQAIDDYLDDDLDGKGINSDNTQKDGGTADYTTLEHAWDEAFGYFGASRDYNNHTDVVLSASGGNAQDSNADGLIDVTAEYTFSLANYANKRDLASDSTTPTDFSKEIFDAFLRGRAIINSAKGALTTEEMKELKKQRDIIANTWEKIIAANIIRYLNAVLVDMNAMGTSSYNFVSHAGHWSEMKGFALGLQFNSKKMISDADLIMIHDKIGVKPVIDATNASAIATYKATLLEVRDLIQDTYDFSDANVGDENGLNGW